MFNRAVLLDEPKAETAAKVRAVLKDAGIPYKAKNVRHGAAEPAVRVPMTGRTGNMTSGFGGGVYLGGGVPHDWSVTGDAGTCCRIYVLKKDLKRAKELCGIQ